MPKPIIICGQQRSGTTALQSALSRVDGVRNFGEIFQCHQPLMETAPHNFYYYVNNVRGGWVALSSMDQAEAELSKYLEYLEKLTPGRFFVADIKYNLWHHFAPGWLNAFGRPFMLEYFKKQKVPVLHVVRENLFRQYVSHEFAARTLKWHYGQSKEAAPDIPLFDIDVKDLAEYFEMVEGNQILFRKRLEAYPHAVELTYETLFEGRRIGQSAERKLRRLLPGWVLDGAESDFVKSSVDPVKWVRNGEAVIDHFRNTRFGVMVIDALRPPFEEPSDAVVADGGEDEPDDAEEQSAEGEDGESAADGTGSDGQVGNVGVGDRIE